MEEIKVLSLFDAAARTASANGSAVDLLGYVNPGVKDMLAYLNVGAVSGTTPTLDLKLQESDDGSTGWTDISGAVFTQATSATSETIKAKVFKRYIRAVATIAGTAPSFTFAVVGLAIARNA